MKAVATGVEMAEAAETGLGAGESAAEATPASKQTAATATRTKPKVLDRKDAIAWPEKFALFLSLEVGGLGFLSMREKES